MLPKKGYQLLYIIENHGMNKTLGKEGNIASFSFDRLFITTYQSQMEWVVEIWPQEMESLRFDDKVVGNSIAFPDRLSRYVDRHS